MELVRHPDVNKVAFTGSTAVGKMIGRAVAGSRKKLTLELGGKAANIVFDDAPLDQAIEGIINGIYFNQGEGVLRRVAPLRAGVGLRAAPRQAQGAPLDAPRRRPARQEHRCRGDQLRRAAGQDRRAGAVGDRGGRRDLPAGLRPARQGLLLPADPLHRRRRAIGSPRRRSSGRSSVLTFRTPEEAIEKANNTPYGLSAACGPRRGAASSRWSPP